MTTEVESRPDGADERDTYAHICPPELPSGECAFAKNNRRLVVEGHGIKARLRAG